ncbi:MAG: S49 family peptidase [Chitinophagales bacterium]
MKIILQHIMSIVLSSVLSSVWFMHPEHAMANAPRIIPFLNGDISPLLTDEELAAQNHLPITSSNEIHVINDYDRKNTPENAPENSIAVIGMRGVMTKYDQRSGGPEGSLAKEKILSRCFLNDNILGVILYVDGPGGEGGAPERIYNKLKGKNKPAYTVVDGLACSAHCWATITSDKIYASSELDILGSIGAYITILDMKGYFEAQGIKLHEIYAKQSDEKNIQVRKIFENNDPSLMKEWISVPTEKFINSVKAARGDRLKDDGHIFKGKAYYATDALNIGLIDAIGSLDVAIADMQQQIINSQKKGSIKYHF